ncbi:hypothetical protein EDB81DRAFT_122291 [Dactylonectria macrodidyma]|uniref:MADS-box domain-containing protein n=1 Tax=Dactylonectria macrodidyma TaxID=307937 RepID=A0A9P9E7Q4_9HYPO|nr:hypothetical protein EDB81DRAFT_122291 [Dactylonectria macrodidyma]
MTTEYTVLPSRTSAVATVRSTATDKLCAVTLYDPNPMDRRRIDIRLIKNAHARQCTFNKRKMSFFRKAYEFAVVHGKRVHVFLQGETPETEDDFFFVSGWEAHEPQDSPSEQAQPSLHPLGPDREPTAMNSQESRAGSGADATIERNILFSPINELPATYRDISEVLDSFVPARSSSL